MIMEPPRISPGHTPPHSALRQTGANILGAGPPGYKESSRPPSGCSGASGGAYARQQGAGEHYARQSAGEQHGMQGAGEQPSNLEVSMPYVPMMPGQTAYINSGRSASSGQKSDVDPEYVPPSAGRTGRLYSENVPQLDPYLAPAQNIPTLQKAQTRRPRGPPEGVPKAVWTDSVLHLPEDEPWPLHAIPLFVFSGKDRPRPQYREEIRFTLRNEKYVSFGLRLRCGTGDHYMGGTIGLLHNPERQEAIPGDVGQLATVTDLIVQRDNTVIVTAVGDLDFTVAQTWMPRGLRGLQLAFVDVQQGAGEATLSVLHTCLDEPGFGLFGQLLAQGGPPGLAEALSGADGPFTVFVPRDDALHMALGGGSIEDMLQHPYLQATLACHVVKGKIPFEALYSGRTLQGIDGTVLMVTFERWPRSGPRVNDIPAEHMDIFCRNGIVHSLVGVLTPAPRPSKRNR